jgi:hypothetical protein
MTAGGRTASVIVVLAAVALLVANGACALSGAAGWGSPANSYAGLAPAMLGMLAFFVAVPAGVVATTILLARKDVPERGRQLALFGIALGSVALFWAAMGTSLPSLAGVAWQAFYVAIFAAGAVAAAAILVLRRRR